MAHSIFGKCNRWLDIVADKFFRRASIAAVRSNRLGVAATVVGQHVVGPSHESICLDFAYRLAVRQETACGWHRGPVVVRDTRSLHFLVCTIKGQWRRWPVVVGSFWHFCGDLGCVGMVCEFIWSPPDRVVESNTEPKSKPKQ